MRFARLFFGLLSATLISTTSIATEDRSDTKAFQTHADIKLRKSSRDFTFIGKLPTEAQEDMRGHSEAMPNGAIAPNKRPFVWATRPNVNLGNNPPSTWTAIIPTGMIYASGALAPDSPRVQIRDLRLYILTSTSKSWRLIEHVPRPTGGFYPENFAYDDHAKGSLRNEPSGGISVRIPKGRNFHFFAKRRTLLPPGRIKGVYALFDARLIDEQGHPVNSPATQYVGSASADYWRDFSASWAGVGVNNDDAAIGKFKLLGGQWRTFSMHTLPDVRDAGVHKAK